MYDLKILDILNQRKIKTAPSHFGKMKLGEVSFYVEEIESWIRNKLSGRFFIQKLPSILDDGKLKTGVYVGFEDHKELTYFMLACPYLRRK
jgi:hypothetical protein